MNVPQHRHVRTESGIELALLEWNAATQIDTTLLLIHGFLDLAWSFQSLVDAGLGAVREAASGLHVIAADMRGHGDSDHIAGGGYYYFADYIADVADIVAQSARQKLFLVGHSMGGTISAYFTGTFPKRVSRLALLEGLGPPENGAALGPERFANWLATVNKTRQRAQRSYASIDEAAERLRENDALCSPAVARFLAEKGTRQGGDGRHRFKHDPLHVSRGPYPFQRDAALRFFSAIECPVLLVDGADSTFQLAPDDRAMRQNAFRSATTAVIANAGHMMHRHQPGALTTLLSRFFSDAK